MTAAINRVRRRCDDGERGSVLVEFSLVIVLFVMLLYGLIAFAMALAFKHSITQAAGEGARSAVGAYPTGAGPFSQNDIDNAKELAATNTVIRDLDWVGSRFDPLTDLFVDVDWCDPAHTATGDPRCITVAINQDYKARPIVPSAPGIGVLMPDRLQSTAIVEVTQ
jgi:hypothetical protein